MILTNSALQKVRDRLRTTGRGFGIRVYVKPTGCSGLEYVLEYLDEDKFNPIEDVSVYPDFVIKTLCQDRMYFSDTILDWVKNGFSEGFEFTNPNEKSRCGCGISFRI